MKKFFTLSVILIIALSFNAIAQDFHPVITDLSKEKPFDFFSMNNRQTEKNGENWWGPDTIWITTIMGYGREIFSYNEQGYLTNHLRQFYSNNNEWNNQIANVYNYGENNNLMSHLILYWEDNQWKNRRKSNYEYDERRNQLIFSEYYWENNEWVEYIKRINVYDRNNNLLQQELLERSMDTNQLENISRITHTYDERNNLLETIEEAWWVKTWYKTGKIIFSYNENGRISTIQHHRWESSSWEIRAQSIFNHDNQNNLIAEIYQIYHPLSGEFINISKKSYTYNVENNLIDWSFYSWKNNEWMSQGRYIYDYDEQDNLIVEINQYWTDAGWENLLKYDRAYNADNNGVSSRVCQWEKDEWREVDESISLYYNNMLSVTPSNYAFELYASYLKLPAPNAIEERSEETISGISIFPNPARTSFTVDLTNQEQIAQIDIFNLQGALVKNVPVSQSKQNISAESFANGVYFVRILTKQGESYYQKLVVIK